MACVQTPNGIVNCWYHHSWQICQHYDFPGACTNNRYRDKSTATAKKLVPINSSLNSLEWYLYSKWCMLIMHFQSDFLGTCTSNRHRDKSTAPSKKLRPINTTLHVLEGESFTCSYALQASPFGPAWAFLELICHRGKEGQDYLRKTWTDRNETKCVKTINSLPIVGMNLFSTWLPQTK